MSVLRTRKKYIGSLFYNPNRRTVSLLLAMSAGIGYIVTIEFIFNTSFFANESEQAVMLRNHWRLLFGALLGLVGWGTNGLAHYFANRGEKIMIGPISEAELAHELAAGNLGEKKK